MSFVNTRLSDHTRSSYLNSERVRWPFFVEFQRYQHIISSKESQQPSASNIGGISNILQHNHRNLAHKIKAVPVTRTFNKTYIKIRQSPTILPANGEEVLAQGEWRALKAWRLSKRHWREEIRGEILAPGWVRRAIWTVDNWNVTPRHALSWPKGDANRPIKDSCSCWMHTFLFGFATLLIWISCSQELTLN